MDGHRSERLIFVALGAVAAAAFGFGLLVVARPTPEPPAMDQDAAVTACESYLKDTFKDQVTFENVQVVRESPSFVIKGTARREGWSDHWTCTIRQDGYQWKLVNLSGRGLG